MVREAVTQSVLAARLETLVGGLHARGLFDGSVVVGTNQDIVWQGGFGHANVEHAVPFTPETAGDAASLAKTFTATLLVMLAGQRRLDLDEPAQRLLPELPYRDITLRHLLSHSSGIPVSDYDYFDAFLGRDEVRTTEALLGVLASQEPALAFLPGSKFEYSNIAFDFAALAGARAAGKPLADLLEERIFAPLGLSSAFLRPGRLSDFPGVRTLAYTRVDGNQTVHDVFDLEAFHGGSNIYISAGDLHRWNASFIAGSLLEPPAMAQLHEPARIAGAPSGLTLGSWYRGPGGTAFWYGGHLQGFHSEAFRDIDHGLSVVYISNNTLEPWLWRALIRSVVAVLNGQEPEPPEALLSDPVRREDRHTLSGTWELGHGAQLLIQTFDSRMVVVSDRVSYQMFQVTPTAFYVPGLDLVIGFAKEPKRDVARIHVSSNVDERWGSRVA